VNERTPIRVLHLEDSEFYARIVADLIGNAMHAEIRRVQTRDEFTDALEGEPFDVILSDHTLLDFDGLSALSIARDKAAGIPFIFVSATIGAERAAASLKRGAAGYVSKDRLADLVPAMQRSLLESRERREMDVATLAAELRREQATRRQVEAENRAKDEFLAVLGHELRNPLWSILSAIELMRLRGGPLLQNERAVIERQARHLVRLVDDLRDVSRITYSTLELKKAPVELGTVIARAVEISNPLRAERRQLLSSSVPKEGLAVFADEDRLVQVIVNLLTNAAKYTPVQGSVAVEAYGDGAQAVLRIRDTGMGIAAALLPRIFDRFVQGDAGREGGLGLGLAIARSIVALHGGTIEAASDGPGTGSTFTVTLPLIDPHIEPR
jgi:signal transduction histidine kinase